MKFIGTLFLCLAATNLNAQDTEQYRLSLSSMNTCFDTAYLLVTANNYRTISDVRAAAAERNIPSPISAFALWTNLHLLQTKVNNLHTNEYIDDITFQDIVDNIDEAWITTRSALLGRDITFSSDSVNKLQKLGNLFFAEVCFKLSPPQ